MKRNIILIICCSLVLVVATLTKAPSDFPLNKFNFHIESGTSLADIADGLLEKKLIRSEYLFKIASAVISKTKGIKAGDYKFYEKENVVRVAYRLVFGIEDQTRIKVTIPEGTNVYDMAYIYLKKMPNFNAARFVSLAKKDEGYLYPDTYYFLENTKPEKIIETMKVNFNNKLESLEKEIEVSDRSLKDIIIMSSIVERESNLENDKKVIAGILWKRFDEGMHLQVDPPFYYITNRNSSVTYNDLKIDSPYNTYKYKGLPKGPISNPSIETIKAVLHPLVTKYYFYLTGHDGIMRYAIAYDGHLRNKNIYLR